LQGIPFRTSHDIVGRSVALALSKRVELSELSVEEFKQINPVIEEDVYSFLGSENAISKFQ
jgi:argininosuccinate lyase